MRRMLRVFAAAFSFLALFAGAAGAVGAGSCEPLVCGDTNHPSLDPDGDGFPDHCDNCPADANPDQTDHDGFSERGIAEEPGVLFPVSVYAADLDVDGDLDVLSASGSDDKIAWYENLDGAGTYGPQRVISNVAEQAASVFAADMDGDGDTDILSAARVASNPTSDVIVWYENADGAGNFGLSFVVAVTTRALNFVSAADLDGDGDNDILAGATVNGAPLGWIAWWENQGGGSFGGRIEIGNNVQLAVAVDFDGDDDLDVVGAGSAGIRLYENLNGAASFAQPTPLSTVTIGAVSVTDLDGDGDFDFVGVVRQTLPPPNSHEYRLVRYENLDGLGGLGPQISISPLNINGFGQFDTQAADMDGDGDMDIVCGKLDSGYSVFPAAVAWFKNLGGGGGFATMPVANVPSNAIYVADLDGDGNPDVVSAGDLVSPDRVVWYEALSDGAGDVCDCAPSDPLTLPPPAVVGPSVEHLGDGHCQLTWPPAPGASSYSVTRGVLSELSVGHYGACLGQTSDVTYIDEDVPDPGTGYAYLVCGISGSCGSGSLGFDSCGGERFNLDVGACP